MTRHAVTAGDLARFSLFGGLPAEDLAGLAARAERRIIGDGDALFEQGHAAATMFAVERGQVVLRSAQAARATIVMIATAGEVLGWVTLRPEATWLTNGRASGETVVIAIPSGAILDLLARGGPISRDFAQRLFALAASHLAATQTQLVGARVDAVISGG